MLLETGLALIKSDEMKKLDKNRANNIINEYGLKILNGIWHYSFNDSINKKCFYFKSSSGKPLIIKEPLNIHCPSLIYGYPNNQELKLNNTIISKYQKSNKEQRKVFWYLKLTTLDSFLSRRTEISSNPRKHFPTTYTYNKLLNKITINLYVEDYYPENFNSIYDQIRPKDFSGANEIVGKLVNNIPDLPIQWLKTAKLYWNNEIVAIALIVDDKKSISLENITSIRHKYSFGIILCLKIIQKYSLLNYYSFDAGVSNIYGVYKDKIFLDSFEISRNKIKWWIIIKQLIKKRVA